MQGKPIEGFENEYFITESGKIIDLETSKNKIFYYRGNEIKPRVDLYKNGILEMSTLVEDIVSHHFFGKFVNGYYKLNFKDNDKTNLSLSNLIITTKDKYITKKQIKKPNKIYELTLNGPILINHDEIEEVKRINYENSIKREKEKVHVRNDKRKNKYVKKLPAKDTPEYHARLLIQKENDFILSKIKEFNNIALRDNVKSFITYDNLKERLISNNYCCEVSNIPLTFDRGKDNTAKIKRLGSKNNHNDITLDTITITAKRIPL
jgi:hypothetical protein